ncbi:MAG TPA: TolC family protein [Terriglobales bacterium]|nr:TolC family protein [Terriglobales bacterium]
MLRFSTSRALHLLQILLAISAVGSLLPCSAEPLPFQRAIQLALAHSPAMQMATAEQVKAQQAYFETRNVYLPQLTFGSGIAQTWGFPLSIEGSAPAVFQVGYQSTLVNFAQREFIRSAQHDVNASSLSKEDQRKAVILETSLAYLQLDILTSQISVLQAQKNEALHLENVVTQRVQQGVDSQMELTRARLAAARVRMRMADLEGSADLQRQKLSQLTGLPAQSIETVPESIPKLPEVSQDEDLPDKAIASSPAVKMAEERVAASNLRAMGEHKAFYPSIDLVMQYGLFSKYNNYDLYFNHFQRNNATLGASIRFPFLNFVQRARAAQADAEIVRVKQQAETVKNQVSAETLHLQRQVKQLAAAQQVAMLEYQLAQSQAEALQIRVEAGTGAGPTPANLPESTVTPPNPRDLANARLQASDRYNSYLDTTFELERSRMQLLKSTGEIENWALPGH